MMMMMNLSLQLLMGMAIVTVTITSNYVVTAFITPSQPYHRLVQASSTSSSSTSTTMLHAQVMKNDDEDLGLFKAGLLANLDDEAMELAKKKIKSVQDLGWKASTPKKRRGKIRPKHWAFGGSDEKSVQNKPNYDPNSPLAVESWLSLKDFYVLMKDDTAIADTIFVALAGGGAFIERDVAEEIIATWRPSRGTFDEDAFAKSVRVGRNKFLIGWVFFLSVTGFCLTGIIFPTNPLQLALVDILEQVTHSDENLQQLAEIKRLSSM